MIGAFNQRWIEQRNHQIALDAWRWETDASIAARRIGRAERSHAASAGHAQRIHDAHQRDALINQAR